MTSNKPRDVIVEAGTEEFTDDKGKTRTRPAMQGQSRPSGQCVGARTIADREEAKEAAKPKPAPVKAPDKAPPERGDPQPTRATQPRPPARGERGRTSE